MWNGEDDNFFTNEIGLDYRHNEKLSFGIAYQTTAFLDDYTDNTLSFNIVYQF